MLTRYETLQLTTQLRILVQRLDEIAADAEHRGPRTVHTQLIQRVAADLGTYLQPLLRSEREAHAHLTPSID